MSNIRLTLACWNYDRTRALADGSVRPDGIDLTYLNLPVEETFFRMLRYQEFEVAELSRSLRTPFRSPARIRLLSRSRFSRRAFSAIRASSSRRRAACASRKTSSASASEIPNTR